MQLLSRLHPSKPHCQGAIAVIGKLHVEIVDNVSLEAGYATNGRTVQMGVMKSVAAAFQ